MGVVIVVVVVMLLVMSGCFRQGAQRCRGVKRNVHVARLRRNLDAATRLTRTVRMTVQGVQAGKALAAVLAHKRTIARMNSLMPLRQKTVSKTFKIKCVP